MDGFSGVFDSPEEEEELVCEEPLGEELCGALVLDGVEPGVVIPEGMGVPTEAQSSVRAVIEDPSCDDEQVLLAQLKTPWI